MSYAREELIKAAIAADPSDPLVHFAAGGYYLETGRYDEAVKAFQTATRIKPDYSAAWLGLARSFAGAGDDDDARSAYERAIAVAMENRDLRALNDAKAELEQLDEFS